MDNFVQNLKDFLWPDVEEEPPRGNSVGVDLAPKKLPSADNKSGVTVSEAQAKQLREQLEDLKTLNRELKELSIYKPGENVRERLKLLLLPNMHGFRSCELMSAYYAGILGIAVGLLLRKKSAIADSVRRFRTQHKLSLFESKKDYAIRQVTFMGYNYLVDELPRGFRLGFISFSSVFTVGALGALRDQYLLRDVIVGYATVGFLYRIQRGFKAAFAATLIGTGIGCLAVILMYPYFLYHGKTVDAMIKDYRQQYFAEKLQYLRDERHISDIMYEDQCLYFTAKKKYQATKHEEMERLATLHNLNVHNFINSTEN